MSIEKYGMKVVVCLMILAVMAAAQTANPKPERGFKHIFNGKDLTGWEGDPKHWSVEDGALTGVADGTLKMNSFIIWRGGTVKNFEMRVQVKITKGGNSGLQYRSAPLPEVGPYVLTGYQCDVVQNRNDYNGMLYEERGRRILAHTGEKVVVDTAGQPWVVGAVGAIKDFAADEWHDYRVVVSGNHHQHWIDGIMTADVVDHDEKGRRLEGLVGVQVHVGPPMKVQFKNWRIKTLPDVKLIKPEQTPIPPNAPKVVPQGGTPQPARRQPTLFIIGDSTVNNSTKGLQGWGTPITEFFDTSKIKIENRARGGRSSRTFLTEGLWQQVLDQLQPGDFVLMQFGHNDGGAINDDSRARGSIRGIGEETQEIDNLLTKKHEVVHSFGWYMRRFISDAKSKGAMPIVLSLVARNIFKDGKVERGSNSYGKWAREAAEAGGALFIDLNELTARHYEQVGPAETKSRYFLEDHTHTAPAGARVNAALVVKGVKALKDCPLAAFINANYSDDLTSTTERKDKQ